MEAFLPGLTQSQVKSGLRSYNPMEVVVEEQEFAESKSASENTGDSVSQNKGRTSTPAGRSNNRNGNKSKPSDPSPTDAFMDVPDSIDEELPFN